MDESSNQRIICCVSNVPPDFFFGERLQAVTIVSYEACKFVDSSHPDFHFILVRNQDFGIDKDRYL